MTDKLDHACIMLTTYYKSVLGAKHKMYKIQNTEKVQNYIKLFNYGTCLDR